MKNQECVIAVNSRTSFSLSRTSFNCPTGRSFAARCF